MNDNERQVTLSISISEKKFLKWLKSMRYGARNLTNVSRVASKVVSNFISISAFINKPKVEKEEE